MLRSIMCQQYRPRKRLEQVYGPSRVFWRYFSGFCRNLSSHPSQQRKTILLPITTRTGVPIEPSRLPVTGQVFCRATMARSDASSVAISFAGFAGGDFAELVSLVSGTVLLAAPK